MSLAPPECVLLCFIDPRVRKIRNETSSCPEIFSRNLHFCYVTISPGSPLPHLLDRDGHRKLVGCSAIPARSCPGPVGYPWGSIVELEVPPNELLGLMTLHPHNINALQSIINVGPMLNHHTQPTNPSWDKKTNTFDMNMVRPVAKISHPWNSGNLKI